MRKRTRPTLQPLESAEDFEAEIAAELDDEEGGEGGEDEDFVDTVTLLPDEVMQADLVEDPIEKTAVMPAPPTVADGADRRRRSGGQLADDGNAGAEGRPRARSVA